MELLITTVQSAVAKIPEETQKALAAKIGADEGQVLAPIQHLVTDVASATREKIKEIRDLLTQDIDPANENTTLGKALRALRDLLDPNRTDSVQGLFDDKIKEITAVDGALAKAVKAVVADAVTPLVNRVDSLTLEVRGQDAAAEALAQTTSKGASYEEEVMVIVREWAHATGVEVHHVGPDNRPGDILLKIESLAVIPAGLTMVLEVRDRQMPLGRMAIADALNTAMAERGAATAVYVSRSRDGLGKEIGEWAEGVCERGRFVACTHEHLITAIRFLMAQERLAALRVSAPAIDSASIEAQLQRLRTALGHVKTINSRVTDVRAGADAIQVEAEALRDEVRGALTEIEDALRRAPTAPDRASGASA